MRITKSEIKIKLQLQLQKSEITITVQRLFKAISLGLFVDYFMTLIETSYRNLHDMFVRTYGQLYEQNADIFVDLFTSLRFDYLADTAPRQRANSDNTVGDVRRSLDRFFVVLLRRMLTLLNRERAPPTDQFLYCVSSRIDQLRPFGDVPNELSIHLSRAFAAARTFVVGLRTATRLIASLSQVRQNGRVQKRPPFYHRFL